MAAVASCTFIILLDQGKVLLYYIKSSEAGLEAGMVFVLNACNTSSAADWHWSVFHSRGCCGEVSCTY